MNDMNANFESFTRRLLSNKSDLSKPLKGFEICVSVDANVAVLVSGRATFKLGYTGCCICSKIEACHIISTSDGKLIYVCISCCQNLASIVIDAKNAIETLEVNILKPKQHELFQDLDKEN